MPNYDAEIERESLFQQARDEIFRIKVGLIECKKECQHLKEQIVAIENKLKDMAQTIKKERYDV